MSTPNNDESMLTTDEAIALFKNACYSPSTFRQHVRAKKIHKYPIPGRTRGGLYLEREVRADLANARPKNRKQGKGKSIVPLERTRFLLATPEDMPEVAVLLETFFESKIKVQNRIAWIMRNPEILYILRSPQRLVGCAFVMPLPEEKILDILARESKPPTRPDDIQFYEPEHAVTLYVRSFGVLQSVDRRQRKHWAAQLIYGLIKAIIALGARGIVIEKIYAQCDSRSVEKVLRLGGFTQIISITKHKNYVLEMQTSGTVLATRYRDALNEWIERYGEE